MMPEVASEEEESAGWLGAWLCTAEELEAGAELAGLEDAEPAGFEETAEEDEDEAEPPATDVPGPME